MTGQQPQQQAQPPQDLGALLVVQAATLLTLEAGSAYAAAYSLRGALDAFRRLANRRWMLAGGSPVGMAPIGGQQREHVVQELVLELRRIAAGVERDVPPILRQEAQHALELGAQHAAQQIGDAVDAAELVLDETAHRVIDATPRSAVSHLLKAAEQVERAQTGMDLQTALAEAERSVASVNTGSTYVTNQAANDASRQVAVRRGEKLLWIAERDACFIPSTRVLAPAVFVDAPVSSARGMASGPLDGLSLDPSASGVILGGDPGSGAAAAVARPMRDRFREVQAVSSREYVGDVVRIRTASGKQLTGTPNHPIATRGGWIPLGELAVGDHVFSRTARKGVPLGVDPDDDDAPPTIEQVSQAFPVPVRVVPTSAEDFHGDGAGSDVHVVRADRLLLPDDEAAFPQHGYQVSLQRGDVQLSSLDGPGLRFLRFVRSALARIGGYRSRRDASPLLGAELVGSAEIGSRADAMALEPPAHRNHVDAVDHGYFLGRLAAVVEPDEIVDVWRGEFSGHVYNLQTVEGWYLAEDIVAHNCVVCLKLSGDVVDPNEGEGFDELATYGPYTPPDVWPPGMPLMRPPRHPHCRCQTCVWLGSLAGQPDLPERLKHEAARSVLKGWSLPSESNTVRLKAAEKLLHRGGRGLPKSVQEEAARAVARGKFQSRTVPHKPSTTTKEHTHV